MSDPTPPIGAAVSVWAVHTTRADEVRPTEALYSSEAAALQYAQEVSRDDGILAASVIRFAVDRLGERRTVAMFVRGARQEVPYVSDCRTIHGGGRSRYCLGEHDGRPRPLSRRPRQPGTGA